ncbi:YdaU family protein [Moraxella haemolytica]|uniref:YdaU family protein n=1 Tax=Moraxella haemolytica TaxID=2904119 RepID=UPI0025427B54|nr:YdaU family protein [Moraxella sp. ZY171148]WII94682.1 YdaU family protein [Moraxella sp. ZY171148]
MNFYNFHINDFNAATRHLSHLERSFYRDLIDMYYDTEKPITGDLVALCRRLAIRTDDERQALQNVLDEFFTLKNGKYRHARIDREIKHYQHRHTERNDRNEKVTERNEKNNGNSNEKSNATPLSNAQRQARHRQKAKMLETLKNKGVKMAKGATFDEILTAYNRVTNAPAVTERNAKSNGKSNAITNNQEIYILASYEQEKNFEKNNAKNQKPTPKVKTPTTPDPTFAFSQAQIDTCRAKQLDINQIFTKFTEFYTARGFRCTDTTWSRLFDNWVAQERLPDTTGTTPDAAIGTGSVTPTGESYTDYLARIQAENRAFAIEHGMLN